MDEENGSLRSILKRAKASGVSTKALIAAHQAAKQEPDVVKREMQDMIRYLALRNMPFTQTDLFGVFDAGISPEAAAEQDEWDADDAGYQAGMHGQTGDDCPFAAGSPLQVAWMHGLEKGKEAAARTAGPDAKVANASRKRPTRGGDDPNGSGEPDAPKPAAKGRGRPAGSKNKPKMDADTPAANDMPA